MRYISLFITVPLAFMAIVFAVANPQIVDFKLAPVQGYDASLPLFAVALAALFIGLFCGALLVWLHSWPMRIEYWRQERKIDRLEKDLYAYEQKERREESSPRLVAPTE